MDTQDTERRRLERDIHDGAQQHLVALAVNLRLAQTLETRAPERAERVLSEQRAAAEAAIETLVQPVPRDLPTAARRRRHRDRAPGRARRQPGPGDRGRGAGGAVRRPDVEAAVYFCCLEAVPERGQALRRGPGDGHPSRRRRPA